MKKKKTASASDQPGKIFVFSNVEYPESKKISASQNDLLIFLNKAASASYYADAPCRKEVWHRTAADDYGKPVLGLIDRCVFDGTPDGPPIPASFIEELKQKYDWNYPIESGKARCMTTGYMVVKYLEAQFPDREIVLVNFGFQVAHSTYRCPWHNWRFEAAALANYKHIFTAETRTPAEIVYCSDEKYLEQVRMSAATVRMFNPDAHITLVSASPIESEFDNVVIDCSDYKFRPQPNGHLSQAAYLKLLLPDALPNIDKIIFLDGDTLIRGPLDELFETEVDYIGICHSHDAGIRQAEQIGVKQYGLTAVMLMNLAALRRIEFSRFAMYAQEHFVFPRTPWYCDETVINCCFADRLIFLPVKWDLCINRPYSRYPDAIGAADALIWHYIGGQRDQQRRDFLSMTGGK